MMATLESRLKALEGDNPTGVRRFRKRTDAEKYASFGQGKEGFDLKAVRGKTYDEKYRRMAHASMKSGEPLTPEESHAVRGWIEWFDEFEASMNDPDILYDLDDGKYARKSDPDNQQVD
jgi:hypothetical protein